MGLPYTIADGQFPSGDRLHANFAYLAAGKGVKVGTLSEIKGVATGTDVFLAWATDIKTLYFYTGDPTIGDQGLIVVAGTGGGTSDSIMTEDIG